MGQGYFLQRGAALAASARVTAARFFGLVGGDAHVDGAGQGKGAGLLGEELAAGVLGGDFHPAGSTNWSFLGVLGEILEAGMK